ncbi:hypothetical protein CF326_g7155 [Tilletia indica]|nr:hypothetical protein CF326_g7155 [Tilletia indica]
MSDDFEREDSPAPAPTSAVFHTFTDKQFQEILASRSVSPTKEPEFKDSPTHPSFDFDASAFSAVVSAFPRSSLDIPDDIVSLFNAHYNIPLSLLTLTAIRDFHVNMRRSVFYPNMTGKTLEEYNAWHLRDTALPFPEWSQAINTLIHLFRSVRVTPEGSTSTSDPITMLSEHILNIGSQVTSLNWPIWREYDIRIRRMIWTKRPKGIGLAFPVDRIHASTLDAAEQATTGKRGSLFDFSALLEAAWFSVISASGAEIARMVKTLNASMAFAISSLMSRAAPQEVKASTSSSSDVAAGKKRKVEHSASAQDIQRPFQAGTTSQPARPPPPAFCIVCRVVTDQHSWNRCPGPAPSGLNSVPDGKGWIWVGKDKRVCAKHNANVSCPGAQCFYGHYCSQCGIDGHRAVNHGFVTPGPSTAAGPASSHAPPPGFLAAASGSGAPAYTGGPAPSA